jgi:hypothetical protein
MLSDLTQLADVKLQLRRERMTLLCKQQEIYRDFFSPRLSGQIRGPVDKLFQSPGPHAASGSFGKNSAQSLHRLGFVWPKCSALSRSSRVRLAERRVVHVQTLFSLWFCPLASFVRKLASFAQNVRDDCTPEPSQSPVRRIAGITISSPHARRTKPGAASRTGL